MDLLSPIRRTALVAILTTPVTVLFAAMAFGSEPATVAAPAGLTIHGPEETLRDFCVTEGGALWLVLPGGARHELVTSTSDPVIANAGDGSFHPFEESTVRTALAALRSPLAPVRADVFLLPYPRRAGLESAAGPGLILLSPGVRPLSDEQQHAEFVHELGHVVHRSRMPDANTAEWARYRELRGIGDESVYNAAAIHANRPHEIFAEDFRALVGGALANYSGTIENASLAPPASVAGLEKFMHDIAGDANWTASASSLTLVCFPNPSRQTVSFARSGGDAEALEVYDLGGRRVATLDAVVTGGLVTWRWDGSDASGAPVGAGVFFARTRGGAATSRVTRVR
jgi:hypothetical protein